MKPNSHKSIAEQEVVNRDVTNLLELLPMAAYAVRAPDGLIVWFNSRAANLWGRVPVIGDTDERFCGAHTLYHADGSYMAHCDTPVALALNTGASVHDEEVIIERPDGSRVSVAVYIDPIRDENGAIVGVVNFFQDITERKKTERAGSLLAAIVGFSDDAIISKSLDGVITSWNKGAERIFGYSAEEAVGQNITLIIPRDRLEEETYIRERLRRGERVEHFETVRVRKDGKLIDISVTISPVKDADGRIIGASKVARDITERKRSEKELRESEERFRTLSESLETMVSLRTQQLEERNADVLEQREQLRELSMRLVQIQDEERRRVARELHDSSGQILTAIGLNLASIAQRAGQNSRIVAAVGQTREMVHQLSKEIRTISYLLHPPLLDEIGLSGAIHWYVQGLTQRSGLEIRADIPEDFGRLPDDLEVTIFRITQECLTNIHRHSGAKMATIRLACNSENVFLEIKDNGTGISSDRLDEIRTSRSGVGITGMRERVRHLRGTFDIQSNGDGTTISVKFPAATPAASGTDIAEKANAAD